jgi:hypothetical protein
MNHFWPFSAFVICSNVSSRCVNALQFMKDSLAEPKEEERNQFVANSRPTAAKLLALEKEAETAYFCSCL